MVKDGAFRQGCNFLGDFKSQGASKLQHWFEGYIDFAEGVNLPIGGASAVEGVRSMGLPRLAIYTCRNLMAGPTFTHNISVISLS